MRWARLAPSVLLALLAPALCAAQPAPAAPAVSVIVYHAFPDPAAGSARADPFASSASPPSERLPRTIVDRTVEASDAPGGDPASTSAHFLEMRRLVQGRQRAMPDLPLTLEVTASGTAVVARVSLPNASAVVVEDGLEHDGDSGVRVHRFVARAVMTRAEDGSLVASWNASWSRDRLAVVAWLDGADGVAQSATWRAGQDGPTVQVAHAALVEHWTATWCAPCAPSDHALALLAAQNGLPLAGTDGAYAGKPTPLLLAGLALGGAAGVLFVRRRGA